MFHLTLAMGDMLLLLIFTWAFLRSQWERSFRAHYTLKLILPRAMAAMIIPGVQMPHCAPPCSMNAPCSG